MSLHGSLEDCLVLTKPQRAAVYLTQALLMKKSVLHLTSWVFREPQRASLVMEDARTKAGMLNQQSSARPESRVSVSYTLTVSLPCVTCGLGTKDLEARNMVPDVQSSQQAEITHARTRETQHNMYILRMGSPGKSPKTIPPSIPQRGNSFVAYLRDDSLGHM